MSVSKGAARGEPDDRVARPVCPRCERPVSVCYCAALVSLETNTRIVILQHPREQGMPIGTAHMATLCLPQATLHVGREWDDSDVLRAACGDPEHPAVLLYPGPDARDILSDPPSHPVTLIVVDGTWSQARGMVRDNPRLAALPRYAFEAPRPSNYRIRREPRVEYVSTLEALMHVLGALERDAARFRALMRPMDAMVDAQIEAQARAPRPRQAKPRPTLSPAERLPAAVRERFGDLVLVFGDASAWPWDTPQHALGDELIYWVACRPSTGEVFASVIAPRNPLAPDAPRHTELPAEVLFAGVTPNEMLRAFQEFIRPSDVVCSWGHHGLRMFKDLGGELPGAYLDLRQAARMFTNRKNGTLEHFAAETAAEFDVELPPGRAGRRLGMLVGILAAWRRLVPA
jgi:DTW domain-containing protein YfiP